MVQFSALATEFAGLLELVIAFGPDLGLEAEELVAGSDVADSVVQAVVVVVVDTGGDDGVGAVGREGVNPDGRRGPRLDIVERARMVTRDAFWSACC